MASGVLLALPTMAAARAIYEFFRERIEFDSWDDGADIPIQLSLEEPHERAADVPLPR